MQCFFIRAIISCLTVILSSNINNGILKRSSRPICFDIRNTAGAIYQNNDTGGINWLNSKTRMRSIDRLAKNIDRGNNGWAQK